MFLQPKMCCNLTCGDSKNSIFFNFGQHRPLLFISAFNLYPYKIELVYKKRNWVIQPVENPVNFPIEKLTLTISF